MMKGCVLMKITRSLDSFVISLKYPCVLYTCICSSISIASSFQLATSLLLIHFPLDWLLPVLFMPYWPLYAFYIPWICYIPSLYHTARRQAESSPRVAFADNNTDICENEDAPFRTEVGWSAYESVLHSKIVWIAKLGRDLDVKSEIKCFGS